LLWDLNETKDLEAIELQVILEAIRLLQSELRKLTLRNAREGLHLPRHREIDARDRADRVPCGAVPAAHRNLIWVGCRASPPDADVREGDRVAEELEDETGIGTT
jgi:hypothetical protein